MTNYIGRKCKGFRFKCGVDGVRWVEKKESHIGEVGLITNQGDDGVMIQFENDYWIYPISLIEEHLIEDEILGNPTVIDSGYKLDIQGTTKSPEIPQLGAGVEMEVSANGIDWHKKKVIAQTQDGLFIDVEGAWWKYARPIQEVKKYTKEELVKILGHDFEIV